MARVADVSCYTTARWSGVRVALGRRAAERLARDAAALGLGAIDPERALAELVRLGAYRFGTAQGVVRLEARRDERGALALSGSTRALGPEPRAWSAITARARGAARRAPGAKVVRPDVEAAREARRPRSGRGAAVRRDGTPRRGRAHQRRRWCARTARC